MTLSKKQVTNILGLASNLAKAEAKVAAARNNDAARAALEEHTSAQAALRGYVVSLRRRPKA